MMRGYRIWRGAFGYKRKGRIFQSLNSPRDMESDPKPEEVPQEKPEMKEEPKVEDDDGVVCNPYTIINKTNKEIDYNKLINRFGCYNITPELVERMEKYIGRPVHYFIRRGIFFSHRDLDMIMTACENHKDDSLPPFYLYTGRGPSSEAMHLGHMLPFIFCKWMQEAFNVPFVIQITDDEKYFHKEGSDINDFTELAYENIKDILAVGFDPEKTFICLNTRYMGHMYPNVCRFLRHINLSTLKAIFGLEFADNLGKASYPANQAVPCLSSTFPHFFGVKNIPCLIPCGIDQDPYFRMTRDVCAKLKAPKPAGLYAKFFPSLQGFNTKMSASMPHTGIFMTDTAKQIETKVKKHAFSGGKATKEEQEKEGADLSVDIAYHYLRFFLEDEQRLNEIAEAYSTGKMLTGSVKKELISILQKFVATHQETREKVTRQQIEEFMSTHQRKPFWKKA